MKAYFIGGGVGSLAGAAFLVRDGAMAGGNIIIFERQPLLGGSLDGARLPDGSYSLRGGRMLRRITTNAHGTFFRAFLPWSIPDKRFTTKPLRSICRTKLIRKPVLSTATALRWMSRRWLHHA